MWPSSSVSPAPGKTTLSSDPNRQLVGDDEHGWSARGVFNFEGGCYAKMIRLSEEAEPQIYATTQRFGTVLENVAIDSATRGMDLDDDRLTENTRGAYPISFIDNSVPSGQAGHPNVLIMLTADAFGVLPPISKLTPAAAMYHFLSGYTAKVAGTEKGVTEPNATFSACFGAPFMVWHPNVYAKLLGQRIAEHGTRTWLVNTGWTGGPFGVGRRMSISHTRAMITAALSGALDSVPCEQHPMFGSMCPSSAPGVPREVLRPRDTWTSGADYDAQAQKLAGMFADNFRAFASAADEDVRAAGPHAVNGLRPVIGLEIHAQLRTDRKIFCDCGLRLGLRRILRCVRFASASPAVASAERTGGRVWRAGGARARLRGPPPPLYSRGRTISTRIYRRDTRSRSTRNR